MVSCYQDIHLFNLGSGDSGYLMADGHGRILNGGIFLDILHDLLFLEFIAQGRVGRGCRFVLVLAELILFADVQIGRPFGPADAIGPPRGYHILLFLWGYCRDIILFLRLVFLNVEPKQQLGVFSSEILVDDAFVLFFEGRYYLFGVNRNASHSLITSPLDLVFNGQPHGAPFLLFQNELKAVHSLQLDDLVVLAKGQFLGLANSGVGLEGILEFEQGDSEDAV